MITTKKCKTEYFPAPNHEYEENYNSLPDDQSGGGGYEDAIPMVKDPYRGVTNFMNHHQHQQEQANGFFGPPITSNPSSYYQDAPAGFFYSIFIIDLQERAILINHMALINLCRTAILPGQLGRRWTAVVPARTARRSVYDLNSLTACM